MRIIYIEEEFKKQLNEVYKKYKHKFTKRIAEVYVCRFLEGMSLQDIGRKFNISRQRVFLIQKKIMEIVSDSQDIKIIKTFLRKKILKNWNMTKVNAGYRFHIKKDKLVSDFTIKKEVPENFREEFANEVKSFIENKYKKCKK